MAYQILWAVLKGTLKCKLTTMYKHQLAMIDMLLGEVQNRPGGGTLQG